MLSLEFRRWALRAARPAAPPRPLAAIELGRSCSSECPRRSRGVAATPDGGGAPRCAPAVPPRPSRAIPRCRRDPFARSRGVAAIETIRLLGISTSQPRRRRDPPRRRHHAAHQCVSKASSRAARRLRVGVFEDGRERLAASPDRSPRAAADAPDARALEARVAFFPPAFLVSRPLGRLRTAVRRCSSVSRMRQRALGLRHVAATLVSPSRRRDPGESVAGGRRSVAESRWNHASARLRGASSGSAAARADATRSASAAARRVICF